MTRSELKNLFLIIMVFIAACIETDIYLPAFPDMMVYFQTSEEVIQSLLTWNFLGLCISGPFYGPISDAYGRKKPLLVALGLFLVGSVLTLYAESFDVMLWGRVLQGLGSGGCFTLGTAIIFDVYQEEEAITALNRINAIVPFIMAGAPMLGGYLNYTYGFRSNFLAIAITVVLSFVICALFFKEPLPRTKRVPLQVRAVARDFWSVLTHVPFWQLTLVVSLVFAGYLAFLATAAILFVLEFGVSKFAFPFFQAVILAGWLAASLCCSPAMARWGKDTVKRVGLALVGLGGAAFVAAAMLCPTDPYALTATMLVFIFGANWTQTLYFSELMEFNPEIKGIVASVLTSTRLLICAAVIAVSSHFYDATIMPVAVVILGVVVCVLALSWRYEKAR